MKTHENKISARTLAAFGAGTAAGFINGFLGSGGGIILLYLFRRLSTDCGEERARNSFASVVAAVLPLCAVSAVVYSHKGMGDISLLLRFTAPAAAGGVLGAYLTDKLDTGVLSKIFAVIVTVAGINMIM